MYILGDWFDMWRNDRSDLPHYHNLVTTVHDAVNDGLEVYFIGGNRDFMPGKKFSVLSGVNILPDPYVLEHENLRILLTHGDKLCTDDVAYQRMRRIIQHPTAKFLFNRMPTVLINRLAGLIKNKANKSKQQKDKHITDVNPQTVDKFFSRYHADFMIHGHVHKSGIYRNNTRFVVGEWQTAPTIALLDEEILLTKL